MKDTRPTRQSRGRFQGIRGVLTLVHVWILLFSAPPLVMAADFSDLAGPVEIELEDGRTHRGQAVAFRDDVLYLRKQLGDGEVERGFPADRILHTRFPGMEVENLAADLVEQELFDEAVPVLEALWRQRAPFLQLLNRSQSKLLQQLPEIRLATGNPGRAIGLSEEMLGYTTDRDERLFLQGVALRAHLALELYPEAETLAREWISRQGRFPRSALGWKILAELATMAEDHDRAAWTAIEPIAFAGPFETPFLADCYALAILAFHEVEEPARAERLAREMHSLRLAWPEEERFHDVRELYEPKEEDADSGDGHTAEDDLDLRPPEQDLNLPLKDVRKLVGEPY